MVPDTGKTRWNGLQALNPERVSHHSHSWEGILEPGAEETLGMHRYEHRMGGDGPRRDIFGWVERKSRQLHSVFMQIVGMVLAGVGAYVLLSLVMRVFEVLDRLLEHIGRLVP